MQMIAQVAYTKARSNRTFMELKYRCSPLSHIRLMSSNRTFMELKYMTLNS